MDEIIQTHITRASDRAGTHPEVASAHALAAIALLLERIAYGRP